MNLWRENYEVSQIYEMWNSMSRGKDGKKSGCLQGKEWEKGSGVSEGIRTLDRISYLTLISLHYPLPRRLHFRSTSGFDFYQISTRQAQVFNVIPDALHINVSIAIGCL